VQGSECNACSKCSTGSKYRVVSIGRRAQGRGVGRGGQAAIKGKK
jgi:hypothetical protein